MADAWEAFRSCGSMAFLALFLGAIGIGVGFTGILVAFLAKGRAGMFVGLVAALVGLSCLGAGAGGMMMGQRMTEQAMSGEDVDPATRERIRVEGNRESSQCLSVGGATAAAPVILGSLAILLAFLRKRSTVSL